jgi:hypothetical protein
MVVQFSQLHTTLLGDISQIIWLMSQFGESMSGWLFPKSTIKHISETEQFQVTSSFTKVGQEPLNSNIYILAVLSSQAVRFSLKMSALSLEKWSHVGYS